MTELRKRMIECLQLRGLSERTQEAYVRAVRQLAEHYHKSPALITEEELRQYFLFLKNVKHYSRNTMTIAISNSRISRLNQGRVTFKYKDSATKHIRFAIVSAAEFRRCFLQHVLPDRFVKVRYYGLLAPAYRQLLLQVRQLLAATCGKLKGAELKTTAALAPLSCPHCGAPLIWLAPLAPRDRAP